MRVGTAAGMSAVRTVVRVLGLPIVLLGLWWAWSANAGNYYAPTPGVVARTFGDVWTGARLLHDALPSVLRLLGGLVAAVLLGVGLGVPIGSSPRLRAFVEPVLEFLRAIPPPVLVPVLMLFAGIGNGMKVLVIVSGCVWPILLNTVEGVRGADPVLDETCHAYGITGRARLRHYVLRSASPQIMTGLRQALSIGIILMVISEMFASSSGLGYTIIQFQRSFAVPEMWTGIVLLGVLGFLLAMLLRLADRRVLAWYHGQRDTRQEGTPS
jgi:ABC-type nitrate/sulfonate/bicarbonate transport system permease component